ncbi:hypothetical protein [Pseudogemmobacter bohemicus]|uniref:hypothetical protein n=1 Tax=Pseudogemmobacter bohemicus TaxID=2250708 RepID=UPI000DD3EB2B|nr:hypothetical protein [Pseudogemmobacter bohemicus]
MTAARDAALDRVAEVEAERDDYKEAYLDTKRLAREIDVALHGEEGAAQQASLCDLVHPAREMRERLAALTPQPDAGMESLVRVVMTIRQYSANTENAARDIITALRSRPAGEVKE